MIEKIKIKKKFKVFFLIYIVLFISYFSLITLSKYLGTMSGSGQSTIAKWEVSVDTSDNESDTLNLVSGNVSQRYILKLTSTSETVATYSIILSDLPDELEVKLDDGSYITPVNNVITYEEVGYINANALNRTVMHILTFKAPIDSNIPSVNQINIDVKFVQKRIEDVSPAFTGTLYRNDNKFLINNLTINEEITIYYPSDEYETAEDALEDGWYYVSETACLEDEETNNNCRSGNITINTDGYVTDASDLNTERYLKHDIENNVIVASYTCFITDTEHCLKAGINETDLSQADRNVYAANRLIMQNQQTWFQNHSGQCFFNDEYSYCEQPSLNNYYSVGIDGAASARSNDNGCDVEPNGLSYCWKQ